ncbi:hypothetical protein IRJ41_013432 [Triplophysa rosa]|uniref:Apolipoprotein L3 n=1 Tax=Triplophysa rosa TaxID=992332 RepID=A0A9W7T7Y2_TRIRA|nr:hypothetical protein IRJ41_013432 [Triplophysa rosa]
MASSIHQGRRNSMDIPPEIADLIHLKDEFIQLYERDHPELQQCIQRLHDIMRQFEKDFRGSTEGSRNAGVVGIAGGSSVLAGIIGLALTPVTGGLSLVVAGVAGVAAAGGVGTVTAAAFQSNNCSSTRDKQMTKLRQDIEAELKTFQDKINPMAEKIKDLHERTEKVMRDLEKLQQDAGDLSLYSPSQKHTIRLKDLRELTAQMSDTMRLIANIVAIFGGVNLLLDVISVIENNRALDEMDKLAKKSIDEKVDESEMKSKAGKFIVGMRKQIQQLQTITDELTKTKDKMEDF